MKGRLFIPCLAFVVLCVSKPGSGRAESPNDILIIANHGVSVGSLSQDELKAFYLKQRTSWKGGARVVPIHAKENTPLRKVFVSKVLSMQLAQELSYWQEQKIRKGIAQPPEFGNTLKAVFKIRGALGYVFRKDYREGVVKVLLVLPD